MRGNFSHYPIRIVLALLAVASLLPVLLMIILSLKSNLGIITDFWAMPNSLQLSNYTKAFQTVWRGIFNSLLVAIISCLGIVFLSSLSGFVFARHRFPAKEILFFLLLALVMIPQILLLVPLFIEVKKMGITDTYWALILPYMAGGQIVGILLCRGFIAQMPREFFESARMDGASEIQVYRHIVFPMILPIVFTIAIINFHAIYNDFIWPLMVLQNQNLKTFAVAIFDLSTVYRFDYGSTFAAYTIGSLPLVILLLTGMKYFIRGVAEGGIKS